MTSGCLSSGYDGRSECECGRSSFEGSTGCAEESVEVFLDGDKSVEE